MKKLYFCMGLAIIALAVLGGCAGPPGKTYVQFTYSATDGPAGKIDGALLDLGGFPASPVINTEYEIAHNSYSGTYVLYYSELTTAGHYDPPTAPNAYYTVHYHAHFNTSMYSWGPALTDAVAEYQTNWFAANNQQVSYQVVPNYGPDMSTTGADKHYVLTLAWDPKASTIKSLSSPAASMKVVEDTAGRIVKELADGDRILRLTITRKPAALYQGVRSESTLVGANPE